MTTAGERLEAGLGLAARGNLQGAREAIEAQLDPLDARAHELLCVVCRALEDIDAGRRYGEVAYRLHRDAGNLPRAAFAAVQLAKLADFAGYEAARRGWMGRAARMLAQAGPCVEEGYYHLGQVGCDVADVTVLERSATAALAIARSFNDADLEIRALADAGLALVSQGRIDEGLAYLDEAMAAIVAGEVRSVEVAGMSCCAMLSACDRLGDLDRAMEWKDAILISMRDRFGDPPPPVLQAHCRVVYGGLLAQAGQWAEAEAELRQADQQTRRVSHRSDACARLADLRIRQGRPAEAAELLRGWEDRVPAAGPLARLHLARGETDLAAATVAGALRQVGGDVLTSAPLLALQVEIAVRAGDLPTARAATETLEHAASSTAGSPAWRPCPTCARPGRRPRAGRTRWNTCRPAWRHWPISNVPPCAPSCISNCRPRWHLATRRRPSPRPVPPWPSSNVSVSAPTATGPPPCCARWVSPSEPGAPVATRPSS